MERMARNRRELLARRLSPFLNMVSKVILKQSPPSSTEGLRDSALRYSIRTGNSSLLLKV